MSTIISASEVTVRYNERAILDDVTLGIQEERPHRPHWAQRLRLQDYISKGLGRTAIAG